jgi:hypothetical protein
MLQASDPNDAQKFPEYQQANRGPIEAIDSVVISLSTVNPPNHLIKNLAENASLRHVRILPNRGSLPHVRFLPKPEQETCVTTTPTVKSKPGDRYLQSLQKRYAKAGKKGSGRILDDLSKRPAITAARH